MSNNGFTPTQLALLAALADGYFHSRAELQGCLRDDMAVESTLRTHLTRLRKKLRMEGKTVIYEGSRWRLVRLLPSATDGKR
jgi:DNA-binding CsgD family transcriptional regulator